LLAENLEVCPKVRFGFSSCSSFLDLLPLFIKAFSGAVFLPKEVFLLDRFCAMA
jgi:hypothetical protein